MSDLRAGDTEFRHSKGDRIVFHFVGYAMACFGGWMLWVMFYKAELSICISVGIFSIASILLISGLMLPALFSSVIIIKNNAIQQRILGRVWVNFLLDENVQINKYKMHNEFAKDEECLVIKKKRSFINIGESIVGYNDLCNYIIQKITSDIHEGAVRIWPDHMECDVCTQIKLRSGCPIYSIGPASEIYAEFGIYGMDLREIIDVLKERYGTNFDEFFVEDYGPGDSATLVGIRRKLGWRRKYKSLTVGRLVEAVRRGAWCEGARPT